MSAPRTLQSRHVSTTSHSLVCQAKHTTALYTAETQRASGHRPSSPTPPHAPCSPSTLPPPTVDQAVSASSTQPQHCPVTR
eukprot:110299-Rhodomonas_salina.1